MSLRSAQRKLGVPVNLAPVAVLVLASIFSAPLSASTGMDIERAKTGQRQLDKSDQVTPTLAARTESELHSMVSAASDESGEPVERSKDDVKTDADNSMGARGNAPKISTRLPGVSESSLPSFRQQMNRNDI